MLQMVTPATRETTKRCELSRTQTKRVATTMKSTIAKRRSRRFLLRRLQRRACAKSERDLVRGKMTQTRMTLMKKSSKIAKTSGRRKLREIGSLWQSRALMKMMTVATIVRSLIVPRSR